MDMNYVVSFLEKIVNIPSPSGYTKEVMKVVEEEAKSFGYGAEYSRKGGLIITRFQVKQSIVWEFRPMWIP